MLGQYALKIIRFMPWTAPGSLDQPGQGRMPVPYCSPDAIVLV